VLRRPLKRKDSAGWVERVWFISEKGSLLDRCGPIDALPLTHFPAG